MVPQSAFALLLDGNLPTLAICTGEREQRSQGNLPKSVYRPEHDISNASSFQRRRYVGFRTGGSARIFGESYKADLRFVGPIKLKVS